MCLKGRESHVGSIVEEDEYVLECQLVASECDDANYSQLERLSSWLDSRKEVIVLLLHRHQHTTLPKTYSRTVVWVHLNIISSMMRSAPTKVMSLPCICTFTRSSPVREIVMSSVSGGVTWSVMNNAGVGS